MLSLSRAIAAFMTSSIVGTATQVLKGKFAAVYLGPDGMGVYNQISLCFTLVLTLCVLGFPNGITRNVAVEVGNGSRDRIRVHLSSAFLLLGIFSLVACGVGVLFSAAISNFLFVDGGERANLVVLVLLGVPLAVIGYVYRALLNGTRSVQALVWSRMIADLMSVAVFVGLLIPFGITGAVLGFVGLHAIYLVLITISTYRELGKLSLPRFASFEWSAVRANLGYGAHGLIVAVMGSASTLLVSRWIISDSGLDDSGIFGVAYKVATVYLAGVYAAATGYYYASVAQAKDQNAVAREIDNAIMIYMALVPPLIAGLMAGGEILMLLFFSAEFLPAAAILLLLLPGDMFRLMSEVIGQALVAKHKLLVSICCYSVWILSYLFGARYLIGDYGIMGVAGAYFIGQLCLLGVILAAGKITLGYLPNLRAISFFVRAAMLVGLCALASSQIESLFLRCAVALGMTCVWFGISLLDQRFRSLASRALSQVVSMVDRRSAR